MGFWFWLKALAPVVVVHNRSFFFGGNSMFTVVITFLDEVDEYGYVRHFYEFDDLYECRSFYAAKKELYANNDSVSVSSDC